MRRSHSLPPLLFPFTTASLPLSAHRRLREEKSSKIRTEEIENSRGNVESYLLSHRFEVRWHPFFLEPSTPKGGIKKIEFYKKKFGAGEFERISVQMSEVLHLTAVIYIIINYLLIKPVHKLSLLKSSGYFGGLDMNTTLLGSCYCCIL